jgi:hypothetical protein
VRKLKYDLFEYISDNSSVTAEDIGKTFVNEQYTATQVMIAVRELVKEGTVIRSNGKYHV